MDPTITQLKNTLAMVLVLMGVVAADDEDVLVEVVVVIVVDIRDLARDNSITSFFATLLAQVLVVEVRDGSI